MSTQSNEQNTQAGQWKKLQDLWRRRSHLSESEWADLYGLMKDVLYLEQDKFCPPLGNLSEEFEFYVQQFFECSVKNPAKKQGFVAGSLKSIERLLNDCRTFSLLNAYWRGREHLGEQEWEQFSSLVKEIVVGRKEYPYFDDFFVDKILLTAGKDKDPDRKVTKAFFQMMFKNYKTDRFRAEEGIGREPKIKEKSNMLIISIIEDIICFKQVHPDKPDTDLKPLPRHERIAEELAKFKVPNPRSGSKLEIFNLPEAIKKAMEFINKLTSKEQLLFKEYFIESKPLNNQDMVLATIYDKANELDIKLRKKISRKPLTVIKGPHEHPPGLEDILEPTWTPPADIKWWLDNNGLDLSAIRLSAKNFFHRLTPEEQLLIRECLIEKKPLDSLRGKIENVYYKAARLGVHVRKNDEEYDEYRKTRIGQWLVQSPNDDPPGLGLSQIEIKNTVLQPLPSTSGDISLEEIPDRDPEEIEDELEKEVIFMIVFQILPACALNGVGANRQPSIGPDDPSPDA